MRIRAARCGMTVLEALLATVLGLAALAAALMILFSVNRMEGAGDVAGALQDAALAMATIQEDLSQAVQKAEPSSSGTVVVSKNSVQLLRGILKKDGSVDAKLVVYQKEATANGNFRLKRTFDGKSSHLPGVYRAVGFVQLAGPGGPYVRAILHVAVKDNRRAADASASGLEEVVRTTLVRVQGPEMAGSLGFKWSFLSLLNVVNFLKNLF
jgi:hypothetical protein